MSSDTSVQRFTLELHREVVELGLNTLQLVQQGQITLAAAVEVFADDLEQTNAELIALGPKP